MYGTVEFSFVSINIIFSVSRNTIARVLILVMAMGTGIISNEVIKMSEKKKLIIGLSFLYFASNVAYLVAIQINKT